jgi:hypothetical protein
MRAAQLDTTPQSTVCGEWTCMQPKYMNAVESEILGGFRVNSPREKARFGFGLY